MENNHDMNECECYKAGLQDGGKSTIKRRSIEIITFTILATIPRSTSIKVSPELLSMYQTMFSMFAKDGDGTIDTKELGTLLRSLGKNPSPDEVGSVFIVQCIDCRAISNALQSVKPLSQSDLELLLIEGISLPS